MTRQTKKKTKTTKATTKNKTTKSTTAKKNTKRSTKKTKKQYGPYEYDPKFLKEMKEMLLQMRQELLEDVSRSVKEESDHLRFNVGDFYDHASEDRQRELALTLSNRERDKLVLIEQALKRIDEGNYGFCEVTAESNAIHKIKCRSTRGD